MESPRHLAWGYYLAPCRSEGISGFRGQGAAWGGGLRGSVREDHLGPRLRAMPASPTVVRDRRSDADPWCDDPLVERRHTTAATRYHGITTARFDSGNLRHHAVHSPPMNNLPPHFFDPLQTPSALRDLVDAHLLATKAAHAQSGLVDLPLAIPIWACHRT